MNTTTRFGVAVAVLLSLFAVAQVGWAAGSLEGHARLEKVKDNPNLGYLELYEYKAFLCKNGSSSDNWGFHCGDPGTAPDPYTGSFVFDDMPAGTYSVMTSFGKFFPRGKVTSSVVISDNQTTYQESVEPVDYSGYYSKSSWESTAGTPIFQTFVATGTSVSRVSFAKADGTSGSTVRITIRDGSSGGNVENWAQVGPSRDTPRGGSGSDHWISWNAGDVQTTPGQTYAVKIEDLSSNGFNMFWCDDSYYPNGTGYRGSQSNPANHDYYIAVFSDNDTTEATMLPRSTSLSELAGWKDAWAQSYTAVGTSLAGAALFGTDGNWEWTAVVTVHQGTPNGTQVGPTKTIHSVYGVSVAGVGGVCYSEGEVPTTKGQTYWIKYAVSGGWNVYRNNEGDIYSGGQASFLQGGSWINQSYDLYMSIYEYDPPSVPTGTNLLTNPGAEAGNFTGWVRGGSPSGQPLIDPSTHYPSPNNHSGSHRFGISVGWSTANCYQYQTIAVKKGESHNVSLWTTHMDGTDEHVQVSWINGSWGGAENVLYDIGPANSGTTWLQQSGQSFTPPASLATIVLRYKHDAASNIASIHVDDISVTATGPTPTNTPTNTPTRTPTRTPTNTPTNTPTSAAQQTITIDDWFDNQSQFDSNWTAYGTSPSRYIKYEYWCSAYGNLVEIQSSNGGYYRIFDEASAGASYTMTVDQVRGNGARYIRVDEDGGTNPAVYDKVWNSNGGTWNCETPSTLTGTVGASGQVTVFLGTTNNGQYRHLRMVFVQGGPEPTNTPTNTPTRTPTNTPTRTRTPTNTPTRTPTSTPTRTPTNTPTRTPTSTPTRTPTNTPTSTPGGCSGEALDSLTNLSFQTSWSYEPTPNDPSGWEVVQWVQGGPQYYTGAELSSGRPSDHRCKYEFAGGGTGSDHVIVKEIEWGSATAVDVAVYCAGRKWDGSSNGTMSIGVDRDGCGDAWSDADVSTGRTSNDESWAQISLTNVTKPSGATTFTLMLRANRSGSSWNCQFDAVSVEDASGFSQAADPAPARIGWRVEDTQEPPRG